MVGVGMQEVHVHQLQPLCMQAKTQASLEMHYRLPLLVKIAAVHMFCLSLMVESSRYAVDTAQALPALGCSAAGLMSVLGASYRSAGNYLRNRGPLRYWVYSRWQIACAILKACKS